MHRKIIWVLEDDFQQIELLEEILGSTYRIRSFRTIEEVSRCIHDAEWPDLFLLDFNLPDGNLLNLIKKYPMIGFHFIVISADYSKPVTLALAHLAEKQNRDFAVVTFEAKVVDVKIFPKGKLSVQDKMDIASIHSSGGGTDFYRPMKKALELCEMEKNLKPADSGCIVWRLEK